MLSIRLASSKAAVPPSVSEISSTDSEPQTGTPSQTAIGAANGMPAAEKHDDTSYFFDTPWSYPETFTEVMATSCPDGHWQWQWEEEQGFG